MRPSSDNASAAPFGHKSVLGLTASMVWTDGAPLSTGPRRFVRMRSEFFAIVTSPFQRSPRMTLRTIVN